MLAVYTPVLVIGVVWSLVAGTLDRWIGEGWPADLALGVLCGLGVVAITALLIRVAPPFERLADVMAGVIGPAGWAAILVAAVASSVAEECFFRGAVQSTAGLWITSAVFAACHFLPDRRFLPWTVFALAAGLGLGALFEWRESLVAPVMAHFTVNFVNLGLLSRRVAGRASSPTR